MHRFWFRDRRRSYPHSAQLGVLNMAERITNLHLARVADAINRAAGTEPGTFFFDRAYGGFSLRQHTPHGERNTLSTGYIPAARAYELAHAFLSGLTFKGE